MKKFAAILLTLVFVLTIATAAVAETKMFAMTTVTDMEGNVLVTLNEEGNVVDIEGNDVSEEFPVLVFSIDDATMTCVFGTEEETIPGTVEIAEQTEEGVVLNVALEDGEAFQIIYTVTGTNACTYVDEENGLLMIMPEIEIAQ